ncbi:GAL10 [Candida oxycetoniae]|uniref:GAL10 n=1 Tax=Candida oxycetoniae TaxID=497107 RepID=A0AAI9WY23_9ASCO|nr:GAL10 [Candida oxycetoniae]KAI3404926.1 GAL10 [Candida oxycetoniae]
MAHTTTEDGYVLVTGGAGYIGSHTVIELINNGYKVVIADNLSNSSYDAVARIEYIVKQHVPFYNVDIKDFNQLNQVFQDYNISGVIHFAALKAVGESTKIPLKYYENNVTGTITLLNVCMENNVKTIVFSSSATVYGDVTRFGPTEMIPIPETCPTDPTNPYGKTKYVIEQILKDIHAADPLWKVAILRYFNPIGAHPSGLLGEDPLGIPNNLLPYLAQVAIGRREKLSVFGNDYDSHDGTPIRDYIHVVDLAKGHIAALDYLKKLNKEGLYREWNLGTGKGSTVFDIYYAFCKAVGRELPYEVVCRRQGDVLDLTAKPDRANTELKWRAELSIQDACKDLWKWTVENPFGFNIENYKWESFGFDNDRKHIFKNEDLKVSICNRGALIQDINFAGEKLVLGFENAEDYKDESNPYFGTTIGRYANRIKNGELNLNDKTYKLTKNEGNNTLHSGLNGFDKQNFFGPVVKFKDGEFEALFKSVDKDGNDGFPGELETIVRYKVGKSSLEFEYESKLVKGDTTAVNLTNHSYFNTCHQSTIDGTEFKLSTNKIMEVDELKLPTGKIISTDVPAKLTLGVSFDTCFVVDEKDRSLDTRSNQLRELIEFTHPNSNTIFTISSTEPAFQFYTGEGINTSQFGSRSGFCIEPSRVLNAINLKEFNKQVILEKGQIYGARNKYEFTKKK